MINKNNDRSYFFNILIYAILKYFYFCLIIFLFHIFSRFKIIFAYLIFIKKLAKNLYNLK